MAPGRTSRAKRAILSVWIALVWTQSTSRAADDREFFESKVRPILVERCLECHSASARSVRGGLLLDTRESTLQGGDTGPALEPGNPDESLIIQAIRYDDPALKMPPKGRLPDSEVAILTQWVKQGAFDPREKRPEGPKPKRVIDMEAERRHWAYQPLARVEPPAVDSRDESWVRNPIDRFIARGLHEHNLEPAPEAAPRVLLRRACFDLLGLPPTLEQQDRFATRSSYEPLIDELLDRPQYGERWARHWLDLARFAESHGFEHDYDRPTAYTYRDFLIEAFNRDLPFDTFVRWQLAGDELAPGEPLALKATGFLAAGTHSTQITKSQVEKERYDELDDMVSTTGTSFLGLTIGCARCHDHKYDPITSRDYYRMAATFTTTVRTELEISPRESELREQRARFEAEHRPYVEALERYERDELPQRLAQWEHERSHQPHSEPRWVVLEPTKVVSTGGATVEKLADGSVRFLGANADFDTYTFESACDLAELTAFRVEALADDGLVKRGPGRAANGNFALTDLKVQVGPRYGIGATRQAPLGDAKATFEQPGLPVSAVIDADPHSGWAIDPEFGKDHAAVFEVSSNLRTDSGCTFVITLAFQNNKGHSIGRLRVSVTDSPRPVGLSGDGVPASVREILARPSSERSSEEQSALLTWFRTIDEGWRSRSEAIAEHARLEPSNAGQKALICSEGLPAVRLHTQGDDFLPATHILRRGDPNQKEAVATPGFLSVFVPDESQESQWRVEPPPGWRTSYRRAALADWLTDVDRGAGALLARVIVNRVWQHHFGRGLVATPSDFGTQGERPSHPELLDWLASELVRGGWKLKPIHRLILTSSTYRQGSGGSPDAIQADLDNVWVGRHPRLRLEAEPLRDAMLAVSGSLDPRMFGPGTLDESMRRRSIYFTVKRSQLIRFMTLFDAPDALVPIAARPRTTVAPQALLLINSPIVRGWAEHFAQRIAPDPSTTLDDSVRMAYRLALARLPEATELDDARQFLAEQSGRHQASDPSTSMHQALVDFCQVLFASNEFIFIE